MRVIPFKAFFPSFSWVFFCCRVRSFFVLVSLHFTIPLTPCSMYNRRRRIEQSGAGSRVASDTTVNMSESTYLIIYIIHFCKFKYQPILRTRTRTRTNRSATACHLNGFSCTHFSSLLFWYENVVFISNDDTYFVRDTRHETTHQNVSASKNERAKLKLELLRNGSKVRTPND